MERKFIEPIALAVKEGNVCTLQRFISDAPWDEDKMTVRYRNLVNDDLGSSEGALIFDETGFLKKGQDSNAGCARNPMGGQVSGSKVQRFRV